MRIGINAQVLTDGRTGVTRFARNIARVIPEIGIDHEFIIFGNPKDVVVKQKNAILVPTSQAINSSTKRILWEQIVLPRLLKAWNIDIMYYPDYGSPFFNKPRQVIVTFHDVTPFAVPSTMGNTRGYYKRLAMKKSAIYANKIITGSRATEREILKYLSIPAAKIHIIPYGLEESIRRVEDQKILEKICYQYKLHVPFILFVGALESRKNIVALLHAFAKGKRTLQWPHNLVLVGAYRYSSIDIRRVINEEGIQNSITLTGHVNDKDLPAIYTLADVFVYPSLYEGFGFPPLEAMKCGCPVIVSNTTSLPEVVGDAGILIDPQRDDEILMAINNVITNTHLQREMRRKGIERSRQFTWERTAQGILNAIIPV